MKRVDRTCTDSTRCHCLYAKKCITMSSKGSREISIWHTKMLTGPNAMEKQRIDIGTCGLAYARSVPLVINVPTTVRHMLGVHENGASSNSKKLCSAWKSSNKPTRVKPRSEEFSTLSIIRIIEIKIFLFDSTHRSPVTVIEGMRAKETAELSND